MTSGNTKKQYFNNRKELFDILSNTSWLFFDKFIRILAALFVGLWMARYLGPEQFGLLSFAIAFIALFAAIATLGIDNIVIREIVRTSFSRVFDRPGPGFDRCGGKY